MNGTRVRFCVALAMFAATAMAQTFSSSDGPVSVGPTTGGITPASPYPTQIIVPNSVTGTVTSVQITLHGLNADGNLGSSTSFLGIVLISPDGRQFELLNGPSDASETLTNLTLNIADGNANAMPDQSSPWPVLTGNYSVRPSSYGSAFAYPSPGPGFPSHTAAPDGTGTFGNVFTGAVAAGTWKLFMADTGFADDVSFTSWDLILTVSATSTSTTTTLASSLNPSFTAAPNNSVTLTATVSSGSGAPTGTVAFKDGVTTIAGCGSAVLSASGPNSSTATCVTSFATEGNHPLVASYGGGGSFLSSTSSTVNQFVKHHSTLVGAQYCNTAAIAAPGQANTSPYPSVVNVGTDTTAIGNSVATLSLSLKGLAGQTGTGALKALLVSPGGANSLVFMSDAGFSANQPTVDLTFSDTGAGQVPQNGVLISTTYQPTSYDSPSLPSPPSPAPQVPGMVSVAAPGGGGNSKTLTTAFNGASPNGDWSLFLFDNGGTQSNVTVANGWCLSITPNSGTPTTTTLVSSLNPSRSGNAVTFTATVKNANTLAPVTIGAVTFTENGVPVAGGPGSPVPVDGTGHAAFMTSSLAEGDHVIVATYNDSSNTFNLSFASITQRNDNSPATTVNGNVTSVCNPGSIAIPASSTSPQDIGAANPNPSNMFVSGVVGTISSVSVSLTGFHHPGPSSVTSLLVGPQDTNAATLDFFSGAGGLSPLSPVNLTFADSGATLVPQNSAPASGTYKPTSYSSNDTYTSSPSGFFTLPGGPYQYAATTGSSTLGSVFGSQNPNGTWSLYFNQTLHASGGGVNGGWCLNFTLITPVLAITKTHSGNFTQGQTGATYSITVTNNGPGSTAGAVTVTDTVPSGLTATSISGTNWTCTQPSGPCTRADALPQGNSYNPITLTVNVAGNAPASVTNTATVTGGGDGTHSANDLTTINQVADLTIAKTHSGSFRQGDVGDTYSITVTNSGSGSTAGTVTVVDTLPSGLTATAISGTGWSCVLGSLTCTRSDVLAPAVGYPAITLTVNVANNAPASVTNSATVSGGGELNTGNDTASDPTTIVQVADLTVAKSHSGNFRQGDASDSYSIVVNNIGPGPTTGTVTVTDTLPAGLSLVSMSGTGWSCAGTTCTRSDALASSSSYPAIALTVSVANNAPASVTNTATVSGGGELNTGNDSASDPTTITQVADLTITKSHSGNFTVGDSADTYTITVSNVGPGPTTGTVTVTDTVPSGLTATGMTGTGWSCAATTCTRSDALASGGSYPPITLTVSVALNAPASVTNVATVSGGGELNTANDTASDPTTIVQTVAVTVQTSPTGLSFTVDGNPYTTTQTFQWVPGSPHTIATTSPQSGGVGTQYVWLNWSDGGAISHGVSGPGSPTTYTANFQQQFLLTTVANPASGGTVSGAGFYNAGSTATVTATANAGYVFVSFTGTTSAPTANPGSVVMNAPTTVTANFVIPTTTVVSAASGEYSDTTTLTATVSPTSVGSQTIAGTVMFTVNGNAAGTAPVNASGVASVPYSVQLAAGSYPITAQFVSSNPAFANSGGGNTLTVTRESATVTPSSSNPFSVQVNTPGGTAGPITLQAAIVELADDSTQGNISNAVPVTCTLTPVVSAPVLTQTATVTGGGVGGTLTASCTFNNVPVNVYDVTFSIGGNFYTGESPVTILAVFDPSAGFTTGGGTIVHNGVNANFGFNAKYHNNGSLDGSLDYVEHRSSGDVHVKGTGVQSLSIVGNTAVFVVQVTLNGVAGYTAQVTVTDNGEPGAGHDTFGLQLTAPNNSTVSDLTFSPITINGGNIQVHSN